MKTEIIVNSVDLKPDQSSEIEFPCLMRWVDDGDTVLFFSKNSGIPIRRNSSNGRLEGGWVDCNDSRWERVVGSVNLTFVSK